jgi:Methyl-accepting chemotaxis protein
MIEKIRQRTLIFNQGGFTDMERENKKIYLSALDEYINKVYVLVLLLVPGACQCAGILYTFEKFMGWLPTVSWAALIVFDVTCLIYLMTGIFFIRTGFANGIVRDARLRAGKIFLVVIMFIQFNFILYMIPAKDFWGFAFFFVVLTTFFLDYKMVAVTSLEIAGSLAVSWILQADVHLPVKDTMFIANMLNRIVCVSLSLPTTVLLTWLIGRFLVNAKKDEMERNNEKVKSVLSSVQSLSENLFRAGTALSKISENESASVEELSATSDQLLEGSNMLGGKTGESMANLSELDEWKEVVADNVEKVEMTSRDLLDKSKENEKMLTDLKAINGEVADSMFATTDVAHKLSGAVEEIGTTLSLINEISASTNLLALNASIEAARAGEAGKGFAVVAQEVGNLANSTKESLEEVETVIKRVQNNVAEITKYVSDNSQKLERQNEYFTNVFTGIRDMTQLLGVSVNAVNTMGEAHDKQAMVIQKTVSINKEIAENIRNENTQFHSIHDMVESNVSDISEIAAQISAINEMADEINRLLKEEE